MKKYFSLIILFLFTTIFLSCKNSYEIRNYKENTQGFTSSISIPEFKHFLTLNELIKNDVLNTKNDFRDNWAIPTWQIMNEKKEAQGQENEISSLFYNADSLVVTDKKYLSVFVKAFFDVGNIVQKQAFSYVWDKDKNKRVNIEEVTGLTLEEISEKCREDLKLKFSNLPDLERRNVYDYIEYATMPEEKKFSYFSVKNRIITVYYLSGKAAPEAYGQQIAEFEF
ncbi:MAG: hypothetical protein K6E78_09095 [Treponema sp.]|nr:hypothetical protein [Treponema sp.]